MQQELYRKLMLETSPPVDRLVFAYLEPLRRESQALYRLCTELPLRKKGTFETRAYFMRHCFEACAAKRWTEQAQLACAAVQLELVSMYYTNRIFDDKGGRAVLQDPHGQFIAAMITRDLAARALADACRGLGPAGISEALEILNQINRTFYVGQYLEVKENIYRPGMALSWERLMDDCRRRNFCVNASFYEKMARIAGLLANGAPQRIHALTDFGREFGLAQQIINDVGDFVPPSSNPGTDEKLPEDAYSDVKHRKLTIPIVFALVKGTASERRFVTELLSAPNMREEECVELTRVLVRGGAIDYAKAKAREHASAAKARLATFSASERLPFDELCFVAYCNRYYKELARFVDD
jgi:hypothetical protein